MPNIEARIATERPNRYLAQLCQHATAMNSSSGHRLRKHSHSRGGDDPQLTVHAECDGDAGVLTFTPGDARCTINATPNLLTVRIDADAEQILTQVRDVITRDLERFGRRDGLIVSWV
jgi:hypothetical protein